MRYGRYGLSHFLMRVGVGVVFLWIGIDMFRHPDAWIGFIPTSLPFDLSPRTTLQLSGAFDIALGVCLIMGSFLKLVALLAALHLLYVLFAFGVDSVLIRDVGLLGVCLGLLAWPGSSKRKHWWQLSYWRRSRTNYEE